MKRAHSKPESAAARRILETASDLFYRQGFRSTGINEVIANSEVAKATFYKHFPSKQDLGRAYIRNLGAAEMEDIEAAIGKANTPRERFLAPIKLMLPWLRSQGYRGCVFLNMVSEVPDPGNPIRKDAAAVYTALARRVKQLAKELIASDKKRYGHLNADELTESYLVAFGGGLSVGAMYDNIWPVKRSVAMIERLID